MAIVTRTAAGKLRTSLRVYSTAAPPLGAPASIRVLVSIAERSRVPTEQVFVSSSRQLPTALPQELSAPLGERPPLSVVVPVRNDPDNLEVCLRALDASDHSSYEVIVVDDASTDATPEVARRHGARVIRLATRSGPAAARNRGAEAARYPYLFFVDADVRVRPETLGLVSDRFLASPPVDAFFGSYDASPGAPNLVSQYRNLLHHHVHQAGSEEASTFWSGCGAIKRSVFLELGGFDAGYGRASIEDIELGARLRRAGHPVALVKDIQVTHMKKWTLARMIEVDVRKRGVPWTMLLLRQGKIPNDLNLRYGQRLSALLAGALLAALALGPWLMPIPLWTGAALACLVGIVALNLSFYRLLLRAKSPLFVLAALPLHVLYYLCSGVAFAAGLALHLGRRRRPRPDPG